MSFDEATRDLAARVLDAARSKGLRIACAESCTGGLVSAALTEIAGSSDVFCGGVVSYALDVKERILGVDPAVLYNPEVGAVSPQCALQMAEGVSAALKADITVSVTGIAGPGGEEPGKPVGTVWFGWRAPEASGTERCVFCGDRSAVRTAALKHALEILYVNLA